MLMLQIIQRLDLGCAFDIALYLTDKEVVPTVLNIFYQTTAVTTNTGITVEAGGLVSCTIDFVTRRDQAIIGKPSSTFSRKMTIGSGLSKALTSFCRKSRTNRAHVSPSTELALADQRITQLVELSKQALRRTMSLLSLMSCSETKKVTVKT